MPPSPSPFAGIKLTEPVPPAPPKLDQRLFSSAPPSREPSVQAEPPAESRKQEVGSGEAKKLPSKEVQKFTSKLVNLPSDPPVNKVGYYFTHKEMDRLDTITLKIRQALRDEYNIKVTKNDIIRACMAIGLSDWEENQLASALVNLLTSK